uniref:Large ribosomal subunit protein bL25 n=1 Tax=Candidatus Kentrum sp. FM TaxID=2126340 RepID=A0A450W3Q8_9GAMM|nr:MAG: large subunit ribosomal protein L25 [Candidatus Kentron sp. FM]VFJ59887.1 MAG: large subunit ribosomal protein L25 [Candidatus Kentron sp. FM]VFK11658.1 MAG: large subunit ribosomal protein L25 [Candidatus Kentron sp. FM]
MKEFELTANIREEIGSRASRRMRRGNSIPAVLYGAKKSSISLSVDSNELKKRLENESFGSHILSLNVKGKKEPAILKAIQRHPVNSQVVHLDFQRVSESQQIQLRIPIHFVNEDISPAKKMGALISHLITEVDVNCLPRNLPEAITVDVSGIQLGQSLHLSELTLPEGVSLASLSHGANQPVATVSMPREMSGRADTGEIEEGQEENAENS